MLNQVEVSDFVLVVCTEQYDRRFRGREEFGKGKGVTWEGGVIIQELYDAQGQNSKFIPITLAQEDVNFISGPLRSATNYKLNTADGYELLYRRLTNQPKNRKPELGKLRELAPHERKQSFSGVTNNTNNSGLRSDKQQLSPDFNNRLINILLKIPSFNMQESRNLLLQNLPHGPVGTVNRSSAPRIDMYNIVCAASAWGRLGSGKLALEVLIENALLFCGETELESKLQDLLTELRSEI
jgi:hypothetical protein